LVRERKFSLFLSLFTFLKNNQLQNILILYHINNFYYYLNKKIHYNIKLFHFFIQIIFTLYLIYHFLLLPQLTLSYQTRPSMFGKIQYNVESCNTISNLIFTYSKNNQHQNISTFFTFYITSIILYYYSNKKKIHYNNFFYFLFFISHLSLFTNSKINSPLFCSAQCFAKHTLYHINHFLQPLKKKFPSYLKE